MWSIWPCVMTTASICAAGTGSGTLLSATMSEVPWKSPQSMKMRFPLLLSRCLLPVTVPAAPTKVSSATRFLHDAQARARRRHDGLRVAIEGLRTRNRFGAVFIQAAIHEQLGILV